MKGPKLLSKEELDAIAGGTPEENKELLNACKGYLERHPNIAAMKITWGGDLCDDAASREIGEIIYKVQCGLYKAGVQWIYDRFNDPDMHNLYSVSGRDVSHKEIIDIINSH